MKKYLLAAEEARIVAVSVTKGGTIVRLNPAYEKCGTIDTGGSVEENCVDVVSEQPELEGLMHNDGNVTGKKVESISSNTTNPPDLFEVRTVKRREVLASGMTVEWTIATRVAEPIENAADPVDSEFNHSSGRQTKTRVIDKRFRLIPGPSGRRDQCCIM
ncbi:hypothetical protein HK102_003504 [Quaeritorhiza haematococci]|nr:hypothetical protein HK102_003504 [Quaeritorhiza haematococci]